MQHSTAAGMQVLVVNRAQSLPTLAFLI